MPAERYFIDDSLTPGNTLEITGPEMHHMIRVSRTNSGDLVEIVNGKGILASARLVSADRDRAVLTVDAILQAEKPAKTIILCQALPKGNKIDFIVEKGTELGATSFWFFEGQRSEKKELSDHLIARLKSLTIAAMKQSGRLTLPTIEFREPIKSWKDIPYPLLYGDVDSHAESLLKLGPLKEVIFVTGPESGLSHEEVKKLRQLGAKGVKLSQHVLRTETASMIAVGMLGLL